MIAHGFGADATRIAERLEADLPLIACEPAFAAAALNAALDLRRRGVRFLAALAWEDERTRLARGESMRLCATFDTWDEVRLRLDEFAAHLDENARYPLSDVDRATLRDFLRLADGLVVRSSDERARLQTALGTLPCETHVAAIEPVIPADADATPTDIVVYAPHERGNALAAYVTALIDVGLPLTLVARDAPRIPATFAVVDPAQAGAALARARVIVDASANDPGTTLALAARGRPLVAGSRSGAADVVRGAVPCDPWDRTSILAAVSDALGAVPPERRLERATRVAARPAIDRASAATPLVTVIVTTYDRPVLLAETLASIERQTYPALEIVVVNDAGPDVSDVVARFARARVIDHAENRGPAAGRNTGLRAARGEFVLFFDDDDEMFPDHVGALAGAAVRSGLDVAYGQMINGFATLGEDGRFVVQRLAGHDALLDRAEIQWCGKMATTAVLFRRRLVDEIGYVDEGLVANEDFEFWMRLAAARPWVRVNDVTSLYFVRTDGASRSNQNARERYVAAHRAIFGKHPSGRPLVNAARAAMLQMLGGSPV